MTSLAKISSKGQITVPLEIREALKVKQGDTLAWEITEEGAALVHRVSPLDLDYLQGIEKGLSEWNSLEDDEAYRDL